MSKWAEVFIKNLEEIRDGLKEELDIILTVWDDMSPPALCAKHELITFDAYLKCFKEKAIELGELEK